MLEGMKGEIKQTSQFWQEWGRLSPRATRSWAGCGGTNNAIAVTFGLLLVLMLSGTACRVVPGEVDHTHKLVEQAHIRSGCETPVEFPHKYYDVVVHWRQTSEL